MMMITSDGIDKKIKPNNGSAKNISIVQRQKQKSEKFGEINKNYFDR